MTCFLNGQPVCCPSISTPRTKYRQTGECVAGNGDAISIDFVAPAELQMEQFTIHFGAVPTSTTDEVVLTKVSVDGSRYTTVLRRINPHQEGIKDIVCVIYFRFVAGDHVSLIYPNSDNQDVGAEILLVEVV